ncbi:sensor histidine kinase [Aquisalinus flavus]|uniref:histidine kinase n=1 Tax=Aquisalinus flavus TaxID=1526572 RepID=A0A8J2V1M0_9PROT|nr:HWE histidine kinase domain-containing protein [Aquisalinus flavus]MBD0427468.1 sensor histidine kinase [Aquisalinus flavus]GGD01241.1 histidine kinase [Aquisalinus flavus]
MLLRPAKDKAAGNPDRPGRPLAVVLFFLVLAVLLPSLLFSVVLIHRNDDARRDAVYVQVDAAATTLADGFRRETTRMRYILQLLSTKNGLLTDNFSQLHEDAQTALAGSNTYFLVLDEQNNQLLNTRLPYGTALGKGSSTEAMDASRSSGEVEMSSLFFGRTSGEIVFNVVYHLKRAGAEPLNLALTQNARNLISAVDLPMAPDWNFAIVDPNNQYAAGTADIATGQAFLFEHEMLHEIEPADHTFVERDGVRYLVSVTAVQPEGWLAVVWVPADVVEAPLRRAWMLVVLTGLLLLLISIGAAAGGAWVLARPIKQLARDAHALGSGEPVAARNTGIAEIDIVSEQLASASGERVRKEEEIRFLLKEVSHRAKNQLTVVGSIARQSLRSSGADPSVSDALLERINALSLSLDRLVGTRLNAAELKALVEIQLDSFLTERAGQAVIEGPDYDVSPMAAQALGLALHELATNAAKYGALSVSSGKVHVTWDIIPLDSGEEGPGGFLVLKWVETGGPAVESPSRTGFGTQIVETYLGAATGANVKRVFAPEGFSCVIRIPLNKLGPQEDDEEDAAFG